jgi:hypothetical protein
LPGGSAHDGGFVCLVPGELGRYPAFTQDQDAVSHAQHLGQF